MHHIRYQQNVQYWVDVAVAEYTITKAVVASKRAGTVCSWWSSMKRTQFYYTLPTCFLCCKSDLSHTHLRFLLLWRSHAARQTKMGEVRTRNKLLLSLCAHIKFVHTHKHITYVCEERSLPLRNKIMLPLITDELRIHKFGIYVHSLRITTKIIVLLIY